MKYSSSLDTCCKLTDMHMLRRTRGDHVIVLMQQTRQNETGFYFLMIGYQRCLVLAILVLSMSTSLHYTHLPV